MRQVIEGGHFYAKEGFTTEAGKGWEITEALVRDNGNESMLFIDDVHEKSPSDTVEIIPVFIDVSNLIGEISERCRFVIDAINRNANVNIDLKPQILKPQHIVLESAMEEYFVRVFEILQGLTGKKKLRFRNGIGHYCSDVRLTHENGSPTCVGFDLGLTHFKQEQGFKGAINVLPHSYGPQQDKLNKVFQRVDPCFPLRQRFF